VADLWQEVAKTFKKGAKLEDPAIILSETTSPLLSIAEEELRIWSNLGQLVNKHRK